MYNLNIGTPSKDKAMTDKQENAEFNLPEHLTKLVEKYGDGFGREDKEKLIANIRQKKDNPEEDYYLQDLTWWPDKEDLEKKAPPEHQDPDKIKEINNILTKLRGGNAQINKDLNEILSNTELTIAIRPDWEKTNGGMVFQRGGNGEKNKALLFVASVAFNEENKAALPGLISHEMGHLVEFSQRPPAPEKEVTFDNGEKGLADPNKVWYMDGAETAADTFGEMIAQNAGYSSRAFGEFMGKESGNGNNPDHSPRGDFREKNIASVQGMISKNKLRALRGLPSAVKAPHNPARISNVDIKTLKMHQAKHQKS